MILLTILKAIGITLLVILGILLLILSMILFVPVRYSAKGQKEGGDIEAHVRVTWLLRFLNLTVDAKKPEEGELSTSVVVKLLFFKVFPRKEKKGKPEKEDEPENTDPTRYKVASAKSEASDEGSKAQDFQSFDDDFFDDETQAGDSGETRSGRKELSVSDEEQPADEPEKKKGVLEKLGEARDKVCSIPGKVKEKWTDFQENVEDKKQFVNDKLEMINDPRIREALPVIIEAVKKLLLHIAPKKGKLRLDLGREDPADTGKAVGIYSILSPYISKWFILNAYFEEERLDVHGDISGRIRIFTIIRIVLGVWFNKKFKKAYKYIRSL